MSERDFDPYSSTWAYIVSQLRQDRIDALDALVAADNQADSDKLRGRIAFIDELLNLPDYALNGPQSGE